MSGLLTSVMRWIKKRKIIILLFVFSFIVSGLITNSFQLLTIPLYFFNRRLFRQINSRLVYFHWCIIPWAIESWAEYDIRLFAKEGHMERFANHENALCVLNHRGDLDWMIGWVFIERVGMLGGAKAIMKDIAKYLPGIGWTFMFMEYPFLKRDWDKDRHSLAASCRNLADYPVHMLLCLFAEGTRFTPEKHEVSKEFARSRGLPILKHHLIPRTKGFNFIMEHMKGTFPCVYDITICYRDGKDPTLMDVVNAESARADMLIRRYPMEEIDTSSEETISKWLMNLFVEKDKLYEYHMEHGRFPENEIKVPKRPWTDLVICMWLTLICIPVVLSGLYLAWVGNWFVLGIVILAIILADQLFQRIAFETNTAQSSSIYGLNGRKKDSANSNVIVNNGAPSSHTSVAPVSPSDSSKKEQ